MELLRVLTFRKLLNMMQVTLSYYLSKWVRKPLHWGAPISISIEPTTSCNLRCPECPSGLRSFTRPTGMLQPQLFQKLIDEVHPRLFWLTFYFQGEPFLHKQFLSMVAYAHQKKIFTATSTNAHYLTPEVAEQTVQSGLSKLIISIDGTTQDTYEQYRIGGKLTKVLEGTKNIIAAKKKLNSQTPEVVFQFLVVKPNEHQLQDVIRMGEELGVNKVVFKTAQVYDYQNGNPLIPENETYSRYKKKADGTYILKNALDHHCWRMWQSCVITWDGKVVPCCFDKDAQHVLGDVSTQSFTSIWRDSAYQNFRGAILKGRDQIDICKNCSEGTKVWA